MSKKYLKIVSGFILSLAAAGVFLLSPSTYAAETPKYYIQVSPTDQQLGELQPGSKYTNSFTIRSVGTDGFKFRVYAVPFQVNGDNYEPTYNEENRYTYIKDWISFSQDEGYVDSQTEGVKITYTVNVPNDAPGGGQYAAIMAEIVNPETETEGVGVQTVARVGMIVYSHVNGETRSCAKIINKDMPTFLTEPPITANALVENCGNVDAEVKYVLRVFPLFSNEEIYTNEENPTIFNTLPETRRFSNIQWSNSPSFGIYNVELEVQYGGKTETIKKMVIICPIWLIVLIIVFIGAAVFILIVRHKERGEKKTLKSEE